jgi:N6-L-threonylcarbamoyladenine synthase
VEALGAQYGLDVHIPAFELCTDNAAMIGLAASYRLARGEASDMCMDVQPNSELFGH